MNDAQQDDQQAFHKHQKQTTQSVPDDQHMSHAAEGENSRSTSQDDMTQLRLELEERKKEAEDYLQGWKRAQADYQNLKREMQKEKVELAKFANLSLLLELLPVLDNFGRAIQHLPEEKKNDEWAKGVLAIEQQFRSILTSMSVAEVPADGMFNPELHEAVGDGDGQDVPPGTILEVIQPGYLLHGKLIRPAKVRVAK